MKERETTIHAVSEPEGRTPRVLSTRKRRWMEAAAVTFFWVTLAWIQVEQNAVDPLRGGPMRGPMHSGETLYIFLEHALWLLITPGVFWLAGRFSLEGPRWPRHYFVHVVAAVTASVSIDLASHALWNTVVDSHIRPISLRFVLSDFHFFPELLLYLIVLAAGLARAYFMRYRERVDEAARLRAEAAELQAVSAGLQAQLTEARLQSLRMQLNPHFLFNTLNTISAYLEKDPPGVRRMIARLSELLRYTLDKTDAREVSLRQELEFIDGYLEIQGVRMEDRLEVRRRIAPEVLCALVPNLILQPLVENAIKHGVGPREEAGLLELSAWRDGEDLHLSVRDNGPGLSASSGDGAAANSGGIGLRNTRERLANMYGSAQRFSLAPAADGGLVAHIVLPYHTDSDLYTTAL